MIANKQIRSFYYNKNSILFAYKSALILYYKLDIKHNNSFYVKLNNIKMSSSHNNKKYDLSNLSKLAYEVTQNKGTERPFTGEYTDFFENGIYSCVVCGNNLFNSSSKYKCSCGWASFKSPIDKNSITYQDDYSFNMKRVETKCGVCDAHLGHVFDDGPLPEKTRFCINSVSLNFKKV